MDQTAKRRKHARWLITHFNKKYFSNALPKVEVEVGPGKLRCGAWGTTEWDEDGTPVQITIAEANWGLDLKNSFLKASCLHELMHLKLGMNIDHEDPEWNAEAIRLSKLGAFLETV